MKNKRKYKFTAGIQQITMDSPDKSKLYNYQTQRDGENQILSNSLNALSGQYQGIGQMGGAAGDYIKSKSKNKETGSIVGGALKTGASGAALGMQVAGPWGALAGGVGGAILGGVRGKKEAQETAQLDKESVQEANTTNFNKGFKRDASTDIQQSVAKKGKYKVKAKVKTKQPRLIETEGREPIFSPKKKDGTRDLLYYNPNDPTHEEGGVKAVVMPKKKYTDGTSNLMPKRPASKYSLVGSGIMAVGAKQLKVNDINDTAFSQNLSDTPSANAPNAFFQPQTEINQVARQIPEERRKETKRTIRSHKKVNPDLNKIVDPPTTYDMMDKPPLSKVNKDTLYEAKLPKPTNTFNTKNNFKEGGKYIKVYKEGTDGTEPGATYKHTKTFKSKPAYQTALQAHDDSLNLYGQSRYFTDLVKGSGLYNSTVENPEVKNITRSGLGKAQSPLKAYGAPNEYTEEIMSVAGMNPMRKDLYSRKESQYKSFKEWEEAKASGQPHSTHEGYEINMYKHPEMALKFEPDTAKTIEPRRAKFKTSSDNSTTTRTPTRIIQTPTKETVADTSGTKITPVVKTTPTRSRFLGKEKTGLQKLADKANNLLSKVGSSSRMSNGKSVRVSKNEEGNKYVKVYKDGSKGVSLAFSRGEKDPKGGLTQKGVDKYNRATGGNLKMAVTTPPSKLKAGSKAANRRKSFCARMGGMPGPMKKPNGEPSRKALALRKWNC
jgi:hypothetical protein